MRHVAHDREHFAGVGREDFQSMKVESIADTLVVVVDDDDIYREYISHLLLSQAHCRVLGAKSSGAMLAILDNNPVDCIILDYNMGAESGLYIGELVKKRYPDPPPIIMLTGEGGERTIVKAFRSGFSDFVSKKNLNIEELIGAIRGAVDRKVSDRSVREERNRLARLTSFDSMTGLHTSEFMKTRMEELAARARTQGVASAAIVIHLDELESIGGTFGYVMRDRALQLFASRLQRSTREVDVCGRYGEDSFLYLIDREANPRSVDKFCERLSHDLSFEANFDKVSFNLAPRIGAALFPLDGTTVEQVLAAAAIALARAQKSGVPFAAASPPPADADQTVPVNAPTARATGAGEPNPPVANRQTDRRVERRQRVLKRGKILLHGLDTVVDCMIREISSTGARLRMDQYYSPPDHFDLLIVDSGVKRSVVVRWRAGGDVGVQFLT
jgi:two-component system cell cycle response regulator